MEDHAIDHGATTAHRSGHLHRVTGKLGVRVIPLYSNPGRMARPVAIPLPRPRNQLTSRELPEFLRLRRELLSVMEEIHA